MAKTNCYSLRNVLARESLEEIETWNEYGIKKERHSNGWIPIQIDILWGMY